MKKFIISRAFIFFLPLFFLLFIFIIGFLAINKMQIEREAEQKMQNINNLFLPNFSFVSLYDDKDFFTNDDLSNDDYSIINIFASWCLPCLSEHDELLELSKFVNIYAVAFRDIDENIKEYLKKYKNPYKKVGVDKKGQISDLLMVRAVPETFLINRNGDIIHKHQGPLNSSIVALYKKILLDK